MSAKPVTMSMIPSSTVNSRRSQASLDYGAVAVFYCLSGWALENNFLDDFSLAGHWKFSLFKEKSCKWVFNFTSQSLQWMESCQCLKALEAPFLFCHCKYSAQVFLTIKASLSSTLRISSLSDKQHGCCCCLIFLFYFLIPILTVNLAKTGKQ